MHGIGDPFYHSLGHSSDSCIVRDFTVKLIDVYPPSADYPDGYELILTDGIVRARYRNSWSAPAMMAPGAITPVAIAANPISNLFKAGPRIRVDISSSNFPKYDSNPNTGAPEGPGGATRVAVNTVFCSAAYPSHVVLPTIPAKAE